MTTKTKRRLPMSDADRDEAARLIWDEYINFLLSAAPPGEATDSKGFAGRHTSAKAALSHLEQLYKTTGRADEEETGAADAVGGQLDAARAAMASLEGEEADGDDAGDG